VADPASATSRRGPWVTVGNFLFGVGILLILAGQGLRALVIGLAYIRRGGKDGKVYADDLVTNGIFAHSRNPLYVGNIAVFVGLFVVLNSPLGWIVGVGAPYEDYCRRVNRFLPSPKGLRATVSSMRFDWPCVIRKEYGSTFAWITALIGLLFWQRVAHEGLESVRADVPGFLLPWLAAAVLWGGARFLKKTGRLG
jgi:hypothetical protein